MEHNRNWKGGKVRHYKGYIAIKQPDHPKAWAGSGYVFEHILVMEQSLSRYLSDSETVHHKNGVKDDNRLENLELWASNHPAGQRVDDLVTFAVEILAQYAPEKLVNL